MTRVLICGAGSYIGTSFESYAACHYADALSVDTIDMTDPAWKDYDFSSFDAVFHVAGIAHADVGNVTDEVKKKYYAVNCDLALETAAVAKKSGVKQFVFMSSAIVYGDSAPYGVKKRIDASTPPAPANFYGDSKWQADKGLRAMADDTFTVTVLRPPMIYGKNSKGNYPLLSRLAQTLPFFPDVDNERSMLYIENLCEFVCQVILRQRGGIFFPQNKTPVKTSDLVRAIARIHGHRIFISKAFAGTVRLASHGPKKIAGLVDKAFGNMSYDPSISQYDFPYQVVDFEESIEKTEG